MGITRYKKTVECDCGCDYGGVCGKKTTYLFCYNRSCDLGSLYIKDHSEKPESKYVHIATMTDGQISALIDVLSSPNPIEEITQEEIDLI